MIIQIPVISVLYWEDLWLKQRETSWTAFALQIPVLWLKVFVLSLGRNSEEFLNTRSEGTRGLVNVEKRWKKLWTRAIVKAVENESGWLVLYAKFDR